MNMSYPSPSLVPNMPQAPKVFCFGYSHLNSAMRAYPEFSGSRRDVPPMTFVQLQDAAFLAGYQGEDRHERVAQRLAERINGDCAGAPSVLFAFIGGAEIKGINRLSFEQHERPFDFVPPGLGNWPVQPDVEILPYRAVEVLISRALQSFIGFFEELRALVPSEIVLISSPPPVADNAFFMRKLNPHYERMKKVTVPSPSFRYKVWHARNKIFEQKTANMGIRLLWPTNMVLDEKGFLLEKFANYDGLHGRKEYGQQVLAQIVGYLKQAGLPGQKRIGQLKANPDKMGQLKGPPGKSGPQKGLLKGPGVQRGEIPSAGQRGPRPGGKADKA